MTDSIESEALVEELVARISGGIGIQLVSKSGE